MCVFGKMEEGSVSILQAAQFLCYNLLILFYSIDITPDGMKAIVTLSSGDMRRSLNILQVC